MLINKREIKNIFYKTLPGFILLIFAFVTMFSSYNDKTSKPSTTTPKPVVDMKALSLVEFNISNYEINKEIPQEFVPIIVGKPQKVEVKETATQKAKREKKAFRLKIKKIEKKAKKKIDFSADYPYSIRVNRSENFVVVYGIDKHGDYSIPYKAFICSTAKNPNNTPLGIFYITDKYRWHEMVDGTFAQYATRIEGEIMLHSVPYFSPKSNDLESIEYNKLGSPASLGCVRMRVSDIKWIYKHCIEGTEVTIYETTGEESPIPYEKAQKLDLKSKKSKWDPTDSSSKNPWNKKAKRK